MTEQLLNLFERTETLKSSSLAHDELGSAMGFHEVEEAKQALLAFASALTERLTRTETLFNPLILDVTIGHISAALGAVETTRQRIESLVKDGVNQPQYPNQR